MSLDARLRWVLASTVLLSVLLALATLVATHKIKSTNLSALAATSELRDQTRRDAELRRLRTAIGDATRRAERGEAIGPTEGQELKAAILRLSRTGAPANSATFGPHAEPLALVAARTSEFGVSARRLLDISAETPAAIKAYLPTYLARLKALEEAQTDARRILTLDADAAAVRNFELLQRWQAAFAVGLAFLVVLALALILWVRRDVVAPIGQLNRLLDGAVGGGPERAPSGPQGEIGALAAGVGALQRVLLEREDALARLQDSSRRDPLTGLSNRLLFDDALSVALEAARSSGEEVALVCIDVDRFKEINDTRGHAEGDEVLRRVSAMLRDVCGDGVVTRIGGDEFAIIQAGKPQPAAVQALVGDLMLAAERGRDKGDMPVGISVGIAVYPRDGDNDQVLRHHADMALYRAKRDGRGKARFFGMLEAPRADDGKPRQSSLATDLPAGIRSGELALVYQPKLNARANSVTSAEALVRWRHPTRGWIQPDDFISMAEKTGQIRPLTEWVLRRTIADQAWLAAHGQIVDLFVNISAPLLSNADFAETLLEIVAERFGVIGLEITETAIIDNPEATLANLHRFVDSGLKIAIDDYGAGWSSLNNLKRLPAHELKIDRAFVCDISRSHRDPLLVRSTIDLAHALDMKVTAEGVDSSAALALLKVMGCDMIQGFLISHPLPLSDLFAFLQDEQRLAHLDRMPIAFTGRPAAA